MKRFFGRHRGTSGNSYGLALGGIAVGVLAVTATVGGGVRDLFGGVDESIERVLGGSNAPPEIAEPVAPLTVAASGTTDLSGPVLDLITDPDGDDIRLTEAAIIEGPGSVGLVADGSGLTYEGGGTAGMEAVLEIVAEDEQGATALGAISLGLNGPPTAVGIVSLLDEIDEGTDTADGTIVGTVTVEDDAFGENTLSLTGPDAGTFALSKSQIQGNTDSADLIFTNGVLDFEAPGDANGNGVYEVTIVVDDPTLGADPDAAASFTVSILDDPADNTAPAGTQIAKLLPDDGAAGEEFGSSVAVNRGTALVGAPLDNGTGSAYLFDTGTVAQTGKLFPNDGATNDRFGDPVALDGDSALIGTTLDDDNGRDSGSAWFFDTTTQAQTAKLLPNDGTEGDKFARSVALDEGTVVIGADSDDDNGFRSGSAYIFNAETSMQTVKILPDDGSGGDNFGWSVALDGNTALIGARSDDDNGFRSGSAYIFNAEAGIQIAKIVADDGAEKDWFGWSVGLDRGTALIGAPQDDDNGQDSGSAYIFNVETGTQKTKLLPNDGVADGWFGASVALDGGTALIGASGDDDNGSESGSAYLFDAETGTQTAKLLPNDGATGDRFGESVAIDGSTVLIGALWDDDNGPGSGSAYLFSAGP